MMMKSLLKKLQDILEHFFNSRNELNLSPSMLNPSNKPSEKDINLEPVSVGTMNKLQIIFTKLVAKLIIYAGSNNMGLTFGEAYRPPETAALYAKQGRGIKNSLHCQRLAVDFNLFINGIYQEKSEAYKPLGEFWESLSASEYKCIWGGRFIERSDGNHFQIEWR